MTESKYLVHRGLYVIFLLESVSIACYIALGNASIIVLYLLTTKLLVFPFGQWRHQDMDYKRDSVSRLIMAYLYREGKSKNSSNSIYYLLCSLVLFMVSPCSLEIIICSFLFSS